jgi:hypothetical protein
VVQNEGDGRRERGEVRRRLSEGRRDAITWERFGFFVASFELRSGLYITRCTIHPHAHT